MNAEDMQCDAEVDATGLNCPLPILKAKKALNQLQSGQLLKIKSTDKGSLRDFQAFALQTGNQLLAQSTLAARADAAETELETVFTHVLQRR